MWPSNQFEFETPRSQIGSIWCIRNEVIIITVLIFLFQFSGKHFAGLKDLADAVDIDAGAEWELRLYSLDSR
jgi:hypothetical protein